MFSPQETVFLKKGTPSRAATLDSHRHTNPSYLLFWCVCLLYREKMPFHHVRAGLLYPDNYLSSSLTEGSEAFQLTSISTEELGGERADKEGGGARHWRQGEGGMSRVKYRTHGEV